MLEDTSSMTEIRSLFRTMAKCLRRYGLTGLKVIADELLVYQRIIYPERRKSSKSREKGIEML